MRSRTDWVQKVATGTSGDMVFDILDGWKKSEARLRSEHAEMLALLKRWAAIHHMRDTEVHDDTCDLIAKVEGD